MNARPSPPVPRTRLLAAAAFGSILLILLFVGYGYYRGEKEEITRDKYQALAAIGELNSGQIEQWRKDHLAEVGRAAKDSNLVRAVTNFLGAHASQSFQTELSESLKLELGDGNPANILLFDPEANLLFAVNDSHKLVTEVTREAIRAALSGDESVLSGFYNSGNTVHVDAAAAVRDASGKPLAVLVQRNHAKDNLFSLLQFGPTASRSTETVLVQREGEDVVFVNKLRNTANAPMDQRYPMTRTGLPGVQAALGKQGMFEGKDYRGVEVLTDLRPVPGSPWFVVSKVDRNEILADARYRAGIFSLILGLIMLLSATTVALIYRQRQIGIARDLIKAERRRVETEETYRLLFEHMSEGCAYCQMLFENGQAHDWIYISVNESFGKLTGLKDVAGKLVSEVIPGIRENDPELFEFYARVTQTGKPEKTETFVHALQQWFSISVYSPQKDYFVAVFDIITDRKRAEEALTEGRAKLEAALTSMTDAVFISDVSGHFVEFNDAFVSFHRFKTRAECAMRLADYPDFLEVFLPNGELAPLDMWAVPRALRGETATNAEYSLRRKDTGETWTGSYSLAPIRDKSGVIVGSVVVGRDITERKAAEARIARLTQLYAALSQSNQAIVRSPSPEELMPKICSVAVEFGGMKMAWIGRIDEATGKVRKVAAFGSGTDYLEDMEILLAAEDPLGRGPTGTAIREGRPVWCQDFLNDPSTAPWHERGAAFGLRASAAIPLQLKGKTIGALTIYSDTLNAFDEEARDLLVEMAGDISFALEGFAREDERKLAEEAVRQSRNMLAHILNSVPQAVFWKDRNSVYLGCNMVYARVVGLASPEEIVGKTDFDFGWTRQDAEAYIADDREVMEGNRAKFHIEETVQDESGARLWFDTTKLPLVDSKDTVYGVLGVFEDITGRRRAEEELQNLRTAVEQSANTIVITDVRGTIEYVNPAFEKSTGYTSAEAVGQNPRVLKSGEQDEAFYRDLWKTILSGQIWRGEFHNKRKDGSLYWESATLSPVHNDLGDIVHFIAVKEDITERKSLESNLLDALGRAEAGNRAKSEFLAIVSHELRTPLNGVLGFAELLSESSLDDEQREYARTIRNSGNHLLKLVNDILDFSSIEKGNMKFESAPVDIGDLVESACLLIRKTAGDKGLEFRCEMAAGVPEQINGDERRICQILINLLGNAVKFTSGGSVALRIAPASERDRSCLDFSVRDTGPGLSAETISLLFKPFMQADSTLSRRFEGTGLGLAISQRLAEAMGGRITVLSTPGHGSTFTFRLPIGEAGSCHEPSGKGCPPVLEQSVATFQRTGGKPIHSACDPVLVVEDDPENSLLAGKMLEALGWRAEYAANGQEAVEAFGSGRFTAILMDMQMPVMDGLLATRKIRELETLTGAHVPIIALTANVLPCDRERCLAAGMDTFLSKPFNKAQLAETLARYAR